VLDSAPDAARSFVDRYLAGELDTLFERPAGDPAGGFDRPALDDPGGLADALAAQARRRGDRPEQLEAIERLRDPAARAVVTGQQAGLLLGPLFTLSKARTAIRLAQRADRADRPVVAVFWVASQDHDAAEIDHAFLLGPDERLHRTALPFPADVPSGRADWRDGWTARLVDELAAIYGDTPQVRDASDLLRRASAPGGSVAEVFARLVSEVLGEAGLIVLDPMQPEVAARFAPLLKRDLDDPTVGPAGIREAGETLRGMGLRPQLGRADDATNLFVQEGGGPRRLLRFDGSAFHLDGRPERRLHASDLRAWLDADPLSITPAAGLRPVVQDALLPTAQVVVGPGELRYFAQLRGVYRHHGVPMPSVRPRAHATLLEPPVARILARHGLDAASFAAGPDVALRERVLAVAGEAERFDRAAHRLEAEIAELIEATAGLDPTLEGAVRRSRATLERTLRRLRVKAGDALARREGVTAEQFARLEAHLLPDGRPQERALSPFSFFAKFGVAPVMARLATLEPEGRQEIAIDPR
jgi:bacillithiol biosynthesis cysteine-adding enzyme BshC